MGMINNKWLDFYTENNAQNHLSVRRCRGRMMNKVTIDNQHWKLCWGIVILNRVLGTRQTWLESQFYLGNVGGQLTQLLFAWLSSHMKWKMFILTHLRIKVDTICKALDVQCAFRSLNQCGWSNCRCYHFINYFCIRCRGACSLEFQTNKLHCNLHDHVAVTAYLSSTLPWVNPWETPHHLHMEAQAPSQVPRPRQHTPPTLNTLHASLTEPCRVSRIVYTG